MERYSARHPYNTVGDILRDIRTIGSRHAVRVLATYAILVC